ncbi:MAG: hypothetical protein JXB35_10655, partial [Anaerolineae bacterium]|nr:hypothetical protein [Anaerolineae bacterium]
MIESQITQHRTPKNRRRERILLWAILLIGFVPRLLFPTLSEFKLDEATVARRALAIAYQGDLPIEGVGASVGVANLPLFLYLIAIPLRLWNDPLAAVVFVCILNSAAIWACYAVGAAFLSRRAGQIAAFLFAVSPWAILYGRKIWVQNLPLITLGFIAALLVTFVRRRPEALIWAFAGAAALVGLHLGGLAFLPILALTLVLFRRDVQA